MVDVIRARCFNNVHFNRAGNGQFTVFRGWFIWLGIINLTLPIPLSGTLFQLATDISEQNNILQAINTKVEEILRENKNNISHIHPSLAKMTPPLSR